MESGNAPWLPALALLAGQGMREELCRASCSQRPWPEIDPGGEEIAYRVDGRANSSRSLPAQFETSKSAVSDVPPDGWNSNAIRVTRERDLRRAPLVVETGARSPIT